MFKFEVKFLFVILILVLCVCGCASKSKLKQQNAFLAGQNQLLQRQLQSQTPSVAVIGPVKNSQVPWVVGLTLAQAIATADYLNPQAPKEIVITRNGENATLNPDVLLRGTDIPLEPGDIITLR